MAVKCYECGDEGHVAKACPNAIYTPASGTWCGYCDERTRLVDLGDKVKRCPDCHPLRGQLLKQHRKCPSCREIVYEWDQAPCGRHTEVGKQWEHADVAKREKPRDEDTLRALALAQVAESRASREII